MTIVGSDIDRSLSSTLVRSTKAFVPRGSPGQEIISGPLINQREISASKFEQNTICQVLPRLSLSVIQ